jgi:hypothetical protein
MPRMRAATPRLGDREAWPKNAALSKAVSAVAPTDDSFLATASTCL